MNLEHVANYPQKEVVENTVDVERGERIVAKGGKYGKYVAETGKKLLLVKA
ncbi:hypothetical protein [Streptomyces massasporeus]|uniref:hypothetical protein n=1 Tax=Streptomyces massasporeus TaxID=67324 RepID=UPI0016781AB1|nr:hypothetical protein [Streptomyces massasporeus]GGV91367.1 hypothetical protein GCM10010228_81590 [Streptomyces massasporeus]